MPNVSDLSVKVSSDVGGLSGLTAGVPIVRNFGSAVDRVDASLVRMGRSATSSGRGLGGLVSGLERVGLRALEVTGAATALAAALGSVVQIGEGFRLAAELETAGVQLRALTGSTAAANSALSSLRDLAASSPFAFPELLDANKRLLAVGVSAAGIPSLLREVGDVAAGTGTPIGEIADQFARVAAEGSLTTRELLALSHSGVPVVQALAAQFHTTAAGVDQLAESGRLGFAQLAQAFDAMTGPGGRFNGILAAQSQTIGGLVHTLSTTVQDTLADVAETFINDLDIRPAIAGLSSAVARVGPVIIGGLNAAALYIREFVAGAASTFGKLYAAVLPALNAVWSGVRTVWGGIASFVSAHAAQIGAAFAGVGTVLAAISLPAVLSAVGAAAAFVVGGVTALAGALATPIGVAVALGAAAGVLAQRFGLVERGAAFLSAAADYIGTHWRGAVQDVATAGAGLYAVVSGAFVPIYEISTAVWSAVSSAVSAAWGVIRSAASTAGDYLTGLFGSIGQHLQGFGGAFTVATATAGYALSHLGEVGQLASVTFALGLAKMEGSARYTLTTVIPAYAVWFAGNLINIFDGVYSSAKDVFTNIAVAAGTTLANLPGIIRGTVKLDQIWGAIPVGFSAALSALPQTAERQASPMEAALSGVQADLTKHLAGGVADAITKQTADAASAAKKITDAVAGVLGGAKPAALPAPTIGKPDDVKVRPTLDPSALTLGITPEIHRAKALVSGSAESLAARFPQPTTALASAGPASFGPLPAPQQQQPLASPPATAYAGPAPAPLANVAPAVAASPAVQPPALAATAPATGAVGVQQAMAAWQAAAAQARRSDSIGGARHAADQAAARSALQQLRAAQAQRDAGRQAPTGVPGPVGAPMPAPLAQAPASPTAVSYVRPDPTPPPAPATAAAPAQSTLATAQAYRAWQDAQRAARTATDPRTKLAAQQRARTALATYQQVQRPSAPPAPMPAAPRPFVSGYQRAGRGELTDTPSGSPVHNVRSATTGIQAPPTDDMLANLRAANRQAQLPPVEPRVPSRPPRYAPAQADSIAQWRQTRPQAPDTITAYRQAHPDAFTSPAPSRPPAVAIAPEVKPSVFVPPRQTTLPPTAPKAAPAPAPNVAVRVAPAAAVPPPAVSVRTPAPRLPAVPKPRAPIAVARPTPEVPAPRTVAVVPPPPSAGEPSVPAERAVRDEGRATQQARGDPRAAENSRQLTDYARRTEFNTRPLQTNSVQTVSM